MTSPMALQGSSNARGSVTHAVTQKTLKDLFLLGMAGNGRSDNTSHAGQKGSSTCSGAECIQTSGMWDPPQISGSDGQATKVTLN